MITVTRKRFVAGVVKDSKAGRGRLEVVLGLQTRATQNERSLSATIRVREWFGLDLPRGRDDLRQPP